MIIYVLINLLYIIYNDEFNYNNNLCKSLKLINNECNRCYQSYLVRHNKESIMMILYAK